MVVASGTLEASQQVALLERRVSVADARRKAKYGGLQVSDVRRMKDLEEENSRLKRIVANQTLEIDAIKTVLEKKYGGLTTNGR